MNPAGFVFEIACVRSATGIRPVGPSSEEWSWFPGHAWTTAVCGGCLGHLGWRFDARGGGGSFFGLIRDRVVEAA
jgi:hypothetical protein